MRFVSDRNCKKSEVSAQYVNCKIKTKLYGIRAFQLQIIYRDKYFDLYFDRKICLCIYTVVILVM